MSQIDDINDFIRKTDEARRAWAPQEPLFEGYCCDVHTPGWICVQVACDGIHHYYVKTQ